MAHEAHQQLVGQARLAGATRARDADHGRAVPGAVHGLAQRLANARNFLVGLERRNRPGNLLVVARAERPELERLPRLVPHAADYVVDHAFEAELATVFG